VNRFKNKILSAEPIPAPLRAVALLSVVLMPAYSYADPGSGVLLYQLLAGAFVGGLFYFRKLIVFLSPNRRNKQ
jgi:hypothetical protein